MDNNYLQHYGVLGMKWGVRRYQNKDGSLTPRGKKRYDKEMEKLKEEEKILKRKKRVQEKLAKLDAKRKEIDGLKDEVSKKHDEHKIEPHKAGPLKKRDIKDMSDDDLNALKNRLELEKKVSELSERDRSRGSRFIRKVGTEVIATAAWDVSKQLGKSLLTSLANKAFDLDDTEYKVYTNNKKKS